MPDLNEQLTLVRRGPQPFVASGATFVPVSVQLVVGVDRFYYRVTTLKFLAFDAGDVSLYAQAGAFPTTSPPTLTADYTPYAVRGEFPSGTRIRFGSGKSAFIVRLAESWGPNTQQFGDPQPPKLMRVDPAPGGSPEVEVTVATDVDYLPRGLRTIRSTNVWGSLRDYAVAQDLDELGNELSVSTAGYVLRYDSSIASDGEIVNWLLTDSLGRTWEIVGVELVPGARQQYMVLRVKR